MLSQCLSGFHEKFVLILILFFCGRDKLRADLRQSSRHSAMSDQTALEDRRQRLSTRIQSHNAKASVLMELEMEPDLELVVAPKSFDEDQILDEGEEEEGDDVMSEGGDAEDLDGPEDEGDDEDAVDEEPERMSLMMPSSFGHEDITRLGLENLAHQELELRQGQANDALESLRVALGHKALLWRTKVQPANTNKKRTRAWDDIKAARRQVEKHTRSYYRARNAIINLGGDEETMLRYKVIERTDLKMSADVVDPSRLGQRNDALAWFWRMQGNNGDQYDSWMQECKYVETGC